MNHVRPTVQQLRLGATPGAGMWCDALPLLIQMEWHKARAGLRQVGTSSTTAAVSAWAQVPPHTSQDLLPCALMCAVCRCEFGTELATLRISRMIL